MYVIYYVFPTKKEGVIVSIRWRVLDKDSVILLYNTKQNYCCIISTLHGTGWDKAET